MATSLLVLIPGAMGRLTRKMNLPLEQLIANSLLKAPSAKGSGLHFSIPGNFRCWCASFVMISIEGSSVQFDSVLNRSTIHLRPGWWTSRKGMLEGAVLKSVSARVGLMLKVFVI